MAGSNSSNRFICSSPKHNSSLKPLIPHRLLVRKTPCDADIWGYALPRQALIVSNLLHNNGQGHFRSLSIFRMAGPVSQSWQVEESYFYRHLCITSLIVRGTTPAANPQSVGILSH